MYLSVIYVTLEESCPSQFLEEERETGNNIGGRNKAKVMKINGETFKLKTPTQAWDIVKDYPNHVLLESEAVKRLGIRAKPLEPRQQLKPKKIYFLVELPKPPEEKVPRRTRSNVQMHAKDLLECLMLSRRSVSDLVAAKQSCGQVRIKMWLPRAQVEKLAEDSKDEEEMAEKIIDLYVQSSQQQLGRWKHGSGSHDYSVGN